MTIRFLKPWNGYQPDAVVTGLTNEATLIAGGLASADLQIYPLIPMAGSRLLRLLTG